MIMTNGVISRLILFQVLFTSQADAKSFRKSKGQHAPDTNADENEVNDLLQEVSLATRGSEATKEKDEVTSRPQQRNQPMRRYFDVQRQIGQGSQANVFRALQQFERFHRGVRETTAWKPIAIKMAKHEASKRDLDSLEKEARLLNRLDHPGILSCTYWFRDNGYLDKFNVQGHAVNTKLMMVLDYANGGDLFEYVNDLAGKNESFLNENLARAVARQILPPLKYLHETMGVVHGDIKIENIMVHYVRDPENKYYDLQFFKLGDFGLASENDSDGDCDIENLKHIKGTPECMAPEVYSIMNLGGTTYNGKHADLFALGIVIFMCALGRQPFDKASLSCNLYHRLIYDPASYFFNLEMLVGKRISPEFKSLTQLMLAYDIGDRLTDIDRIMSHPFLAEETPRSSEETPRETPRSSEALSETPRETPRSDAQLDNDDDLDSLIREIYSTPSDNSNNSD